MNLVGKVFVVLIFTGSLVFMSFAVAVYGTHKNWKDEILRGPDQVTTDRPLGYKLQLKAAIAEKQRLLAQLEDSRSRLRAEQAARTQALAKLESEKQTLAEKNQSLVAINVQAMRLKGDAIAVVSSTEVNLEGLGKEIDQLRKEIRDTQGDRDTQFERIQLLTDAIHQRLGELSRLTETNRQLTDQIAVYKTAMVILGKNAEQVVNQGLPVCDGLILAVSNKTKPGLVEISIGSDDGLRQQHELQVFREGKYLGKVRVVKTTADKSIASILPETVRGNIVKGDRVASNLQ